MNSPLFASIQENADLEIRRCKWIKKIYFTTIDNVLRNFSRKRFLHKIVFDIADFEYNLK